MSEEQESGKTIDTQCGMTLFGLPIVWTEEMSTEETSTEEMPTFDIVLANWPGKADWQRYLRRKEEEDAKDYFMTAITRSLRRLLGYPNES